MRPFAYRVADSVDEALALGGAPGTAFLAGGTELVAWLKDGIAEPSTLVDISRLPLDRIEVAEEEVRLGALARLADIAAHETVRRALPALAQSIDAAASPQIRAMGTLAGNLLQRTRCPYFRSEQPVPCNKRAPGSGCSARIGDNRASAILGAGPSCVATHPSDPAVALAALDAVVVIRNPAGERTIPIVDLYRSWGDDPATETSVAPGELVTEIRIPRRAAASRFLKVRDRASYAFALVSAGVALATRAGRVETIRIALGGVASGPWRLARAEELLAGVTPDEDRVREAVGRALGDAVPLPGNRFKVELAAAAVTRAVRDLVEGR